MFGRAFTTVSGTLYLGLMTNVLLALGCLPLLSLVLITDPRDAWLIWAIAAVAAVPAVAAAFVMFARHSDEGETAVVRPFLSAWRRALRRGLPVGATGIIVTVILMVDITWFTTSGAGTTLAAVAVPVLVTLMALCGITTLGCLVAAVERPDVGLLRLARAAVYLMLRRWYLTALSVLCAAVYVAVLIERPAIAVGLLATPLLYVVWANTRRAMRPVLNFS